MLNGIQQEKLWEQEQDRNDNNLLELLIVYRKDQLQTSSYYSRTKKIVVVELDTELTVRLSNNQLRCWVVRIATSSPHDASYLGMGIEPVA